MSNFLFGLLIGVIAGIWFWEKFSTPTTENTFQNEIKKVKRSQGVNLDLYAEQERKYGDVAAGQPQPKQKKGFLWGLFKKKKA